MAPVKNSGSFQIRGETHHAFDFNGARGRQEHARRFQYAFERAIIGRTRQAGGALLVHLFGGSIVLGIEIDLANIGDDAHQRTGKAGESGGRGECQVLGHRRCHHHLAGTCTAEVDDRALTGEYALGGEGDGGGESGAAGGLDALIGDIDQVGGPYPAMVGRPVFGAARDRRCRTLRRGGRLRAGPAWRRRLRFGDAPGAERVDQAGVNGQPFAFDYPGVRRNGEVWTHCFDQAVAHRDRAVRDGQATGRNNAGVLDSKRRGARRL